MSKLEIKYLKPEEITKYENNARTHGKEQIDKIKASIKEFGMCTPIGLHKGTIVYGHARYDALCELEHKEIPTVDLSHLTKKQQRAYMLADNRLAELAEWDKDLLSIELSDLSADFDIDDLGFDEAWFTQGHMKGLTDEDDCPEVDEDKPPISKLGDIWLLGEHRLMCGDSLSQEDAAALNEGEKIDMIFTDPPYGLGGYKGRGKDTKRAVKNDEQDPKQFYENIPPASEVYIWGTFKNLFDISFEPRDVIIWRKNNFGMGKGYRGQYEVCFYLGGFSGSDSDVWDVPKDTEYQHPTQKPVCLAERAIKNSKPRNVLDLYGGSGSTLIACEKMGVKCYMMELDPYYIDVIIKRWEEFSGEKAVHAKSGAGFNG